MTNDKLPILVFGATGQQGGSVAAALIEAGWPVRAMVRNPKSPPSLALIEAGVELIAGSFDDLAAMRRAMQGAYGVFSVQPSSPGGTVTDDQEVLYGKTIADLAVECSIAHLVYSSGAGVGDEPTCVAHFDTKSEIEKHIRRLPITHTIVRPTTFMELLVMPGFGLDKGRYSFFIRPDQAMQVVAVEDIGKIVAAVFSDRTRFGGKTFDIASDNLTGRELETLFSEAAGRPITYSRFSDAVLTANPFLQKLAALMEDGRLAGKADLAALREINPELLPLKRWLRGPGKIPFDEALGKGGGWKYNQ